MQKIELWCLGAGELFKFDSSSDLFALVEFEKSSQVVPPECQTAIVKNLTTGKISSIPAYYTVIIDLFDFVIQLTLF